METNKTNKTGLSNVAPWTKRSAKLNHADKSYPFQIQVPSSSPHLTCILNVVNQDPGRARQGQAGQLRNRRSKLLATKRAHTTLADHLVCDGGGRLSPGEHGQRGEDGVAVPLARRRRVEDRAVAGGGDRPSIDSRA